MGQFPPARLLVWAMQTTPPPAHNRSFGMTPATPARLLLLSHRLLAVMVIPMAARLLQRTARAETNHECAPNGCWRRYLCEQKLFEQIGCQRTVDLAMSTCLIDAF